ncbi:hypothetical protein HYU12_03910 [Candidatus Woesearchaeota archaeon]|nr:hypothetical protein [Candidatus Woesearchaeota archaeon]
MTNITLSIEESVYRQMRRHSEIRWSEFVRKAIKNRLGELEQLEKHSAGESILTMLASEETLRKEWDNKADERWDNV